MAFQKMVESAREVTTLYDQLNNQQGFSSWKLQEHLQGFMEDLGTLSRLTMMKSGLRPNTYEDLDERLIHEVCDCLWVTIKIADELGIDLESEFPKQMNKLAKRIKEEKH